MMKTKLTKKKQFFFLAFSQTLVRQSRSLGCRLAPQQVSTQHHA